MEFRPLFRNPHMLTVLGNYWPRDYEWAPYPVQNRLIETEQGVRVLVQTQRPLATPRGEFVLLHGLEGSGKAGYIISLAHRALIAGFVVHRFHMRTCGGTESHCQTLYHAGLTSDLIAFMRHEESNKPRFLAGFSLGGNVAIKAAAEAGHLLAGVATVSAAIDLAACSRRLNAPENRLYQRRFVQRMKARLLRTGRYDRQMLASCQTILDIDECITAPSFGFCSAAQYYETQSALRSIDQVHIPVLMITAQDDTLVPYESYLDERLKANPLVQVLAPKHGGHLGFLSRTAPRFWADAMLLRWIEGVLAGAIGPKPSAQPTSPAAIVPVRSDPS